MTYIDDLLDGLDKATLARLQGGEYVRLIERQLPERGSPLYKIRLNYALASVARGRECAKVIGRFKAIEGSRTLDFGCGHGGFTVALSEFGARVTGIDVSEDNLELARAMADDFLVTPDLKQDRDYGEQLEEQSFDIIVCNDVIEHVDDMDRLARSHARLLKPDGVLYLNAPNRFSLRLIGKDPHYGLLGVSLMNRTMGRLYAVRLRKRTDVYTVNHLLGWCEVNRIYGRAGIELNCVSEERIARRLENRDLPRDYQKIPAKLLPASLLVCLIKTFVIDQWIFIGRKSSSGP